jgi:orotidine-5'-phosphate decarboxylase
MLEAAAEAARQCANPPKLVAVTTLTSLSQEDFADLGINRTVSEQALALGELAIRAGIDGLVTSAHEAGALRERFADALLVTPGIRMPGGDVGDQKRVATPSFAVQQGATHLVVGRPIVQAENPAAATEAIFADIKNALL